MPFWEEESFYDNISNPETATDQKQLLWAKRFCYYYKSIGATGHIHHQLSGNKVSLNSLGAQLNYLTCLSKHYFVDSKPHLTSLESSFEKVLERINQSEIQDDYLNQLIENVVESTDKIRSTWSLLSEYKEQKEKGLNTLFQTQSNFSSLSGNLDYIVSSLGKLDQRLNSLDLDLSSLKDSLVTEVIKKVVESDQLTRKTLLKSLHSQVSHIYSIVETLCIDPDHPNPTETKIANLAEQIHTLAAEISANQERQNLILDKI